MKALWRFIAFISFLLLATWLTAQEDRQWPLVIETPEARIMVYQPQPEAIDGDSIVARAAIAVRQTGVKEPVFGAAWANARLLIDRQARICSFSQIRVPVVKFPEGTRVDSRRLQQILERELPLLDLQISYDQLLASLEAVEQERGLAEAFNNDAPEIIYRQSPAILVIIEGEPQLAEEGRSSFRRVANTPFFIVRYERDQQYYLYGAGRWFTSSDPLSGWAFKANPPAAVTRLGRELVRENGEEEQPVSSDDLLGPLPEEGHAPEVIVRTHPAELIVTEGEPQFSPILNTSLIFVSNTESQVFLDIRAQQYYTVLSGRWYRSPGMNGPWTYVPSDALPRDFANIPEGSEKDVVLAYVAGTNEAREAAIEAQVPQTARVDRRNARTEVEYDGAPQFERVSGSNLEYAVNTASVVLRDGDDYYCVDNGIWYEAPNPYGPWSVAVERPRGVDRIPPQCPVYHARYVYIYDYTPDWVYVGYTSGYLGSFIFGPTVVYGTGYWYRPWYGRYYYPRHWTWGFHVQYDPWWGWGLSASWRWGDPYTWYYPPYRGQLYPGWWISGGWWGPTYYRPSVYIDANNHYGPRPDESREVRPRPTRIYERYPERIVRPQGREPSQVQPRVTRPRTGGEVPRRTEPTTEPRRQPRTEAQRPNTRVEPRTRQERTVEPRKRTETKAQPRKQTETKAQPRKPVEKQEGKREEK